MLTAAYRQILIVIGIVSVIAGVIGLFLPIMPTTPFLILAAYCFSKSSKKLHHWLLTRPHIGATLREWEEHRVIKKSVKWTVTFIMIISFTGTTIFVSTPVWAKVIMNLVGLVALIYIWMQKSEKTTKT